LAKNHSEPNVWKGALAGLVAGLVASWVMDRFQDVWLGLSSNNGSTKKENSSERALQLSNLKAEQSLNQTSQADGENEDDATVKAASALSESVFDHKLTREEKKIAGPAVHYAVGATSGIVYGVTAELLPEVTAGAGLPYGAAFWLVVDEGMVPLFGLSKAPNAYPVSTHIYAFASHLVFGAAAEEVRRFLRG
jgi:putative membrane protein